uniref:Uncharacterized protein n=1 Tax=viral metagenome TaxID=1070528 RepID=A0A6M3KZW2_9ZZZZ
MPDPADLIEQCEINLWQIVYKMHRAGVRYEVVHGIFQEMIKALEIQGYCEDWLLKYMPPDKGG